MNKWLENSKNICNMYTVKSTYLDFRKSLKMQNTFWALAFKLSFSFLVNVEDLTKGGFWASFTLIKIKYNKISIFYISVVCKKYILYIKSKKKYTKYLFSFKLNK